MATKVKGTVIDQMLNGLRNLLGEIEAHQDEIFNEKNRDKSKEEEIKRRVRNLEGFVTFFKGFNEQFIKALGITEHDLKRAMVKRQKGTEVDTLLKTASNLKVDLLLSYAKFLKSATDKMKESMPLSVAQPERKKGTSKGIKPKGGFKKMTERQKWTKM